MTRRPMRLAWMLRVIPTLSLLAPIMLSAQAPLGASHPGLPIQPTRTITFTTREGTWMSIDVSPDGQTIVFDMLGDLYALPVAGGMAIPLTRGMAYDEAPRFSPDGTQIAFISDRGGSDNVWTMNVDGTGARAITRDTVEIMTSPSWSPDGRAVLVRRMRELWRYEVASGAGSPLVTGKSVTAGGVFGPAGTTVYFSACEPPEKASCLPSSVLALDLAGQQSTILATPGRRGFRPLVAPTGRWLVYAARRGNGTELRLRELASGRDTTLVFPVQRDDEGAVWQLNDVFPGYAFTPDGRAVVFPAGGKIQRVELATRRVTEIPFTVQVRAELGPLVATTHRVADGPLRVEQLREVNRSPDGRRLTFGAVGKVWVMDVGGQPRRLTTGMQREYHPTFSPDGQWIAFATWSDSLGGGQLWKAPASGGAVVPLTREVALYEAPRWMPDGRRLVVLTKPTAGDYEATQFTPSGDASPYRLAWVSAEGGKLHAIAQVQGRERGLETPPLTVSSDGTRVYYLESPDSSPDWRSAALKSVALDSREIRTHARIESSYMDLRAVPSPDGHWLALQDRFNVFLRPWSAAGNGDSLPVIAMAGPTRDALLRQLTTEGGTAPSWSPDGRWLTWSVGPHVFSRPLEYLLLDRAGMKSGTGSVDIPRPPIAVNLRVPRPTPTGQVLLRGARIVTMAGGRVLERGDLLLAQRRIAAVGPAGSLATGPGVTVLDVTGKTITPGYIDTHVHLMDEPLGVQDQIWLHAANLAYGVTSVRDIADHGYWTLLYAELVEAGEMIGPRVFAAVEKIDSDLKAIRNLQDAEHVVRQYRALGASVVKAYARKRRVERQWLNLAAASAGMYATSDVTTSLKSTLTLVLDGYAGWEHPPSVFPWHRDVIELVARSGTTYTPTFTVVAASQAYDKDLLQAPGATFVLPSVLAKRLTGRQFEQGHPYHWTTIVARAQTARDLFRAGGNVAIGTDQWLGLSLHREMSILAAGGLTPAEILRCATLNGARALGVAEDLGSIEPGKLADLVILNRNPLTDIRHSYDIEYVVKDGVVYDAETLNTVWPVAKPFPPFPWQQAGQPPPQ